MQGRLGKIVLVVLGVVLMLMFILPAGITNMAGGDPVVGTVQGEDVRVSDMRQAASLLQYAQQSIQIPNPQAGGYVPLPSLVFGPQQAQALQQDPELFFLLSEEARQNGIGVPEENVIEFLQVTNAAVMVPDESSPDGQRLASFDEITGEQIRRNVIAAAGAVLDVAQSFGRFADYVKFSRPMVDFHLALQQQRVDLRTVVFDAADYLEQAPTPTDAEVQAQFEAYRDTFDGAVTPENPFGFGYRLPDRVQFQYISVPQSAVEANVRGDLSALPLREREQILYSYWSDNRTRFPVPPGSPATQPSTQPTTQPTTQPDAGAEAPEESATTQPTTAPSQSLLAEDNPQVQSFLDEQTSQVAGQPIEADWRAYVAVHDDVVQAYIANQTNQLESRITKRLRDLLTADWRQFDIARDRGDSEIPETRVGVPIQEAAYLERLADRLAEEFGVRPRVASYANDFFTREELSDPEQVGAIADAVLMGAQMQQFVPFSDYILGGTLPLLSEEQREQIEGSGLGLELFQPSQTLSDLLGDDYIFRVTEAAQDAPPTELAQVADQVREDLRLKAAYELALAEAQAFAQEAQQTSLADAAGPMPAGREIHAPAPFIPATGPQDPAAFGAEEDAGSLDPAVQQALTLEIYGLLARSEAGEAEQTPIDVLELRPAFRAVVAELMDLQGTWVDATTLAARRESMRQQMIQSQSAAGDLLGEFFDPDNAATRVGFVREE